MAQRMNSAPTGSYWARTLSRRRALAGAAALGVGAAALAACGGSDSSDGGDEQPASGLLSIPQDTTAQATKGGILQYFVAQDVPDWDPTTSSSVPAQTHAAYQYSRLLKYKPGIKAEANGEVEGDLAASYEVLDNGLRFVFKIRPDAGTDPRAPTNGRMMDAEDVAISFARFAGKNPQGVDLARSASPTAPVESVKALDKTTVEVKLAEPYAPAIILMASPRHLWVIPKEAEAGAFNASNESHGSGPWIRANYLPSSRIEYRRNPNWYDKTRPFFDGWDLPIVSEAAQQLAQFRAKNIWYGGVRQEDLLGLKRDLPDVRLNQGGDFSGGVHHIMFGFRPGSPYNDERVRQAISMLIDRDVYNDTFFNVKTFLDEGIEIPTRMLSHLGTAWSGIWMDPRESEFGANGKYFKLNIAEAKSLLSAAGFANGFDTDWTFVNNSYGADWPNRNEVMAQFVLEGGIRIKRTGVDYATRYIPDYYRGKGDFDGISSSTGGSRPDPGLWLHAHYATTGSVAHWKLNGDATFDAMLNAQMREFDRNKRVAQMKDIQRYAGKLMPVVPMAGNTAPLQNSWPWLGNYGVYRPWPEAGVPTEVGAHYWYDKAKHTT
jgi:peptide/nickel transport system substrate-binding protein